MHLYPISLSSSPTFTLPLHPPPPPTSLLYLPFSSSVRDSAANSYHLVAAFIFFTIHVPPSRRPSSTPLASLFMSLLCLSLSLSSHLFISWTFSTFQFSTENPLLFHFSFFLPFTLTHVLNFKSLIHSTIAASPHKTPSTLRPCFIPLCLFN